MIRQPINHIATLLSQPRSKRKSKHRGYLALWQTGKSTNRTVGGDGLSYAGVKQAWERSRIRARTDCTLDEKNKKTSVDHYTERSFYTNVLREIDNIEHQGTPPRYVLVFIPCKVLLSHCRRGGMAPRRTLTRARAVENSKKQR